MSQRIGSSTDDVYTRRGPAAKRAAPDARAGRTLGVLLAALAAVPAARAEERIRVLVSPEPREVVELRLED
jgi:hypothetical protein